MHTQIIHIHRHINKQKSPVGTLAVAFDETPHAREITVAGSVVSHQDQFTYKAGRGIALERLDALFNRGKTPPHTQIFAIDKIPSIKEVLNTLGFHSDKLKGVDLADLDAKWKKMIQVTLKNLSEVKLLN